MRDFLPTSSDAPESGTLDTGALDAAGRYADRWLVGEGGMGEVRLVYDRRLHRTAVMKVVRPALAGTRAARRLAAEAEITARLQHAGIVPVYDAGTLPDGRPFYVMREVRGLTLADAIGAVHKASRPGEWAPDPEGWTFRRLVDAMRRVCETVAYAHGQGVVHRDLKPANVMLEGLGSVLVLDWGIAKLVGAAPGPAGSAPVVMVDAASGTMVVEGTMVLDAPGGTALEEPAEPPSAGELRTHAGAVLGTRGFMAPEQARGEVVGPPADVHALGVTLHVLFFGGLPSEGAVAVEAGEAAGGAEPGEDRARTSRGREDGRQASADRGAGAHGSTEPAARADTRVPEPLARLAERAMAADPAARPTAAELAAEIGAWLDGVRRREDALERVSRADAMAPEIAAAREKAAALQEEARRLLAGIPAHAPADEKVAGWRLEDAAERLLADAVAQEEAWTQLLHGALQVDPELPEAHARLADHYRERHAAAELARDSAAATRAELRLRMHDRGAHRAWLAGDGTLSLDTDPSGAEVTLFRYVLRDRVLVPERVGVLGRTPLVRVPVPWGSLLLRVAGPAGDVDVPVLVGRAEDWALVPPDGVERALWLPRPGDLGPEDCYVPAGWFLAGGDPEAGDPLPAGRRWLDGFVMRRFPVSNAEYIGFLDGLVREGREAEALARVPRRGEGVEQESGEPLFERLPSGLFGIPGTGPAAEWRLDEPVSFISWFDAQACVSSFASVSGMPWRLPHELEWEKAGRGVDGRFLPWGDFLEPTWACTLESRSGPPSRSPNDSFATDASPYRVRGLAGNVRDWCANSYTTVSAGMPATETDFRVARGGAFSANRSFCRLATRFAALPYRRFGVCGFRIVRACP